MRQTVAVAVDADHILQTERDAGFFVGLELWQIDDNIGIHDAAAENVSMASGMVKGCGLWNVVVRAVKIAIQPIAGELTGRTQLHGGVARRVARQPLTPVDHISFLKPAIAAKVVCFDNQSPLLEIANDLSQSEAGANGIEIR